MTLYRMARESQIVQALVEAAENGKGSRGAGGAARPL